MNVELVADRKTKAKLPPEAKVPERLNESFRKHGLIFKVAGGMLSIGPPLCITRDEVDEIAHAIDLSLWELEGQLGITKTT